jgi:His/Glu/Gln/Arg/opine family amino acid ABC transporter permease subunit
MLTTSFSWNDLLFLLDGAWVTLKLTFWSIILGSFAGLLFGLLRALLPRASLPLAWVLDVFRSVPLLIQFVLFNSLKSIVGLNISAFSVGCIVLGVYAAAYFTEIVRSGVLSVPFTVRRASRSLGLSFLQDRLAEPGPQRDERHRAGDVDRHRRTAARLANHRDPHSGAAAGAVHRGPHLLRHEPGGRSPRRSSGKKVARK